jgi:hypothetical protein
MFARLCHDRTMPLRNYWALTPRQSIEAECARNGRLSVVNGCIELLGGADGDYRFLTVLAGPGADFMADQRPGDETNRYWLRVWGARGMLWAWDDTAVPAIREALADPHWRVREMAAKVVAKYELGDLLETVAELRTDPTPRVRAAAEKAVQKLTEANA